MYHWHELIHRDVDVSVSDFFSGMKVWIERPHILNKRVIGLEVLQNVQITSNENFETTLIMASLQKDMIPNNVIDFNEILRTFNPVNVSNLFHDDKTTCQLRRLIPRNNKFNNVQEIIVTDKLQGTVLFLHLNHTNSSCNISPPFPYKIMWEEKRISLCVVVDEESQLRSQTNKRSMEWLKSQVFPKIVNWSKFLPKSNVVKSLSQVPIQVYSKNYSNLKQKYGKKLVESWPEKTDPSKFVYEDIAIAAYLLTLWEEERKMTGQKKKQSFVDLGCGNGLLVYLLSSEGHSGIGIDIRKRNIWDFYDSKTDLIEKEIIPSASGLFPDYDWIIGNHSDELTPWIPVIAARSSYSMRVFLLPCCAFTFDGKYDRGNSSSSKYQSYLGFIEDLCVAMGFHVCRDRLRIPSTKRVCFICSSRNYDQTLEKERDMIRTEYIKAHSKLQHENIAAVSHVDLCNKSCDVDSEAWCTSFKPRDKVELVRNCCSLDPKFIETTVIQILKMLLACRDEYVELETENRMWKCGGTMSIKALADELKQDVLSTLKSQCGGLKTLLRNHKNIFNVQNGYVSLRTPMSKLSCDSQKANCQAIKKRCAFFFHHPDGCPFLNLCTYSHVKVD